MAARGGHGFARKAWRNIFDCKPRKNVLKSSQSVTTVTQVLTGLRSNRSLTTLSLSPKTRQLLTSLGKNDKWNKSVFDSINRSTSSAVVCLLTTGDSSSLAGLCCTVDELSADGDEDSTNRKKRIYFFELLNDDP